MNDQDNNNKLLILLPIIEGIEESVGDRSEKIATSIMNYLANFIDTNIFKNYRVIYKTVHLQRFPLIVILIALIKIIKFLF